MEKVFKERVEIVGQMLRWITPTMMAVIGFAGVHYLNSIDTKFSSIDQKFNTFIATYHEMDKRVDRLEYKVFSENSFAIKHKGRMDP